jgi:hypothetical protein
VVKIYAGDLNMASLSPLKTLIATGLLAFTLVGPSHVWATWPDPRLAAHYQAHIPGRSVTFIAYYAPQISLPGMLPWEQIYSYRIGRADLQHSAVYDIMVGAPSPRAAQALNAQDQRSLKGARQWTTVVRGIRVWHVEMQIRPRPQANGACFTMAGAVVRGQVLRLMATDGQTADCRWPRAVVGVSVAPILATLR